MCACRLDFAEFVHSSLCFFLHLQYKEELSFVSKTTTKIRNNASVMQYICF